MRATIALAKGDGNLWNCCLAVSIEQLGTMKNNGIVLLSCTWEEAWYVYEADNRNVEGIAETNEAGTLAACVGVENASLS